VTFDDPTNTTKFYFNGTPDAFGTDVAKALADNGQPIAIGWAGQGNQNFHGRIDEVRISNVARDACWIETAYNNQSSPETFFSVAVEADRFSYRKQITIDHTKVACTSDVSDFPMLISIQNDPDLMTTANGGHVENSNGYDIIFTAWDGTTPLLHEVEKYDGAAGTLVAWVKIRTLKSNEDTVIYMHYGNSDITSSQENAAGVWDSNYVGVWHLSESSGNALDSTSYGTSGAVSGTVTRPSTGKIGNAYDFFTNGKVNYGDPADGHLDAGTGSWTVSYWVNIDVNRLTWDAVLNKGYPAWGAGYYVELHNVTNNMFMNINDTVFSQWGASSPDVSFTEDTWFHFVAVVDRTANRLRSYKNGSEVGSPGTNIAGMGSIDTADSFGLGNAGVPWFDGILDEVRISNIARDACWIETEHNNQSSPETFFSVGVEANRFSYRKQITIDHTKVACTSDVSDFPMLISIQNDPDLKTTANGGKVENPNGYDIIFTAVDLTTPLLHEVEKYDGAAGTLVAWVKIPTLKSNEDTVIYMHYGNSDITSSQENATGVWDDNYKGVWHLAKEYALDFDGLDDYVDSGYSTHHTQTTIEAWIYPEGWGENSLGRVIDKREAGAQVLLLYMWNTGQLAFERMFDGTDGQWQTQAGTIALNTWQHIAVTYDDSDPANKPSIYINGQLQTLNESSTPSGTAVTNTDDYLVGNRGAGDRTFDGIIDELRIYSRILTSEEINDSYAGKREPSREGLVIEYLMDDGSGTTVTDSSGNGRDGDMSANPATWGRPRARDSTAYRNFGTRKGGIGDPGTGRIDGCDDFDGADDYLEADDSSSLRIPGSFTVSAWINTDDLPSVGDLRSVVGKGMSSDNPGENHNYGIMLENTILTGGNAIEVYYEPSTGFANAVAASWETSLSTGQWYHVVGVHDAGADTLTLFVNGVQRAQNTGATATPDTGSAPLRIGDVNVSSYPNEFNGQIDEVRISSVARDACWIETAYNNQSSPETFYNVVEANRFSYRKQITIDHTKVGSSCSSDLTDFPVLISIQNDPDLKTTQQVSRADGWYTGLGLYTPPAGSDRLLVFVTGFEEADNNQTTITNVTFGGVDMTRAVERAYYSNPVTWRTEIWYLKEEDIPPGSGAFVVTYSPSEPSPASRNTHAYALFTNVDQVNPIVDTDSGRSTTDTVTTDNPFDVVKGGMSVSGALCGVVGNYDDNEWGTDWAEGTDQASGYHTMGTATSSAYGADGWDSATATFVSGANQQVIVAASLAPSPNGGKVENPNGYDIIFTASDGTTQLFHEVEKYDGGTGTLVAWVKIPTLKHDEDTIIYMHYGNSSVTSSQEIAAEVWDSGYKAVWHLGESGNGTAGEFKDSTSNGNHGQGGGGTSGYVPTRVAGKMGDAQDFDGVNDHIDVGNPSSLNITGTAITLEAWVQYANAPPTGCGGPPSNGCPYGILSKAGDTAGYRFMILDPETVDFQLDAQAGYEATSATTLSTNTWHHVVAVYNGSKISIYINGDKDTNEDDKTNVIQWTSKEVWIGHGDDVVDQQYSYPFTGFIDEVRISNIARSQCWIETAHNNQSSPSTFYRIGVTENRFSYRKQITIDSTKVNCDLSDFPMLVSIQDDADLLSTAYGGKVENPNGYDIIFRASDGVTKLDHEIESYQGAGSQVIYYFNGYGAEQWTNYPNMTDGLTSSHAWTSGDGNTQLNNSNTCPGTDLGTIHKVELRVHGGAESGAEDDDIILRPVFGGSADGDDHQVDMAAYTTEGKQWSAWVDITNDTNAPSSWTWTDVQNLDVDVVHKQVNTLENMLASKVDIRVSYGGANLVAWVKVPTIKSDEDTNIYMYYGNSSITSSQENVPGVWSNAYRGVWHLKEEAAGIGTADLYQDSTSSANHGDDGVDATGKDGQIGAGQEFDGTDDIVETPDPGGAWEFSDGGLDAGTSDFTISAWVRLSSAVTESFPTIVAKGGGSDLNTGYWFDYQRSPDQLDLRVSDGTSRFNSNSNTAIGLTADQWHHVYAVFDRSAGSDTGYFYLNGAPVGSETSSLIAGNSASGSDDFSIGCRQSSNRPWMGNIDEVRISNGVRSACWIAAEHANQKYPNKAEDPNGFLDVGNGEDLRCSFSYRKKITINNDQVDSSCSSDFSNFPVLINITDDDLADEVRSDGYDIIFRASDGTTQLDHEIESYSSGSKVTYSFNGYGSTQWGNPQDMADGSLVTHAYTCGDGNTQRLNSTTCPGADLGTITKVELRVHGGIYSVPAGGDNDDDIILYPVFAGGYGDNHQVDVPDFDAVGKDWSVWVDITNDTNAPSPWTWSAVQNLNCDVEYKVVDIQDGECAVASKVEIRVTYGAANLIAWVKIPTLKHDEDTVIYMYYGNSCITYPTENPEAVWHASDGWRGVWHLAESSGDAQDSTAYGTSGTVSGGVTRESTGRIGYAYDFVTSGLVDFGDPADGHFDLLMGISISGWEVSR
jgi:hypothetical protein